MNPRRSVLTHAQPRPSLHPMLWVAAIAITLFSIIGIAKFAGFLDSSSAEIDRREILSARDEAVLQAQKDAAEAEAKLAAARTEADEIRRAAQSRQASAAKERAARSAAIARSQRDYDAPVISSSASRNTRSVSTNVCADCGIVESVQTIRSPANASGVGAVAGGVLGGVAGNQVGEGSGKDVATVAGAVLGGFAGHQVEKRVRGTTQYQVAVRMDDGSRRTVTLSAPPAWQEGDRVSVNNGVLRSAGTAYQSQML